MKLGALVVDDEPLARRRLSELIAEVPWVTQVGEAADGESALAAAQELRPDVMFLDIQMPALSGLEVVRRLAAEETTPAIVFTTAFDRYAITAFELEALDYLLKPFGMHRLLTALERAREVVLRRHTPPLDRIEAAFARGRATLSDRIFVRERNSIVPLPLDTIEHIDAEDDYSFVHSAHGRHLVGLTLRALEEWLPNPPFLRVHRSHIVNLNHVERLVGLDDARFDVVLRSGAVIRASRARSQEIRRLAR